jgi:chromosome partitioning protein
MKKCIAVINQKGGVGKTATSYNLAYTLAIKGNKILLTDLDSSANASKGLTSSLPQDPTVRDVLMNKSLNPWEAIIKAKVKGEEINNLYLLPSRINLATAQRELANKPYRETLLAKQLAKISESFDYGIIDCSPTLSELTINAIYAADFILIPIRYEEDALDGVNDLFNVIDEIKDHQEYTYKILRNGCDARKKTVNFYIEDKLKPFIARGDVFKTIIRQDEEINKAKIEHMPVLAFSPKSSGAFDIISLTEEILNG